MEQPPAQQCFGPQFPRGRRFGKFLEAAPSGLCCNCFVLNGQFPTYEQMKMQAYKAIVKRCHRDFVVGILSVKRAWKRSGTDCRTIRLILISSEFRKRSCRWKPVLISPSTAQTFISSVSSPNIEFVVKSDANKIVIIASNFSEKTGKRCAAETGPSRGSGLRASVEVLQRRSHTFPGSRKTRASGFTDSFGPYEVHVYILKFK